MKLSITEWASIDDLIEKIKACKTVPETSLPQEIERKWLVDPTMIKYLNDTTKGRIHKEQVQGYLSIDPEVRYRASQDMDTKEIKYYLTYKSSGDLVRDEVEVEITMKSAIKIAKEIRNQNLHNFRGFRFIVKDSWTFSLEDGTKIWISTVDHDPRFTYAEVEFDTVESAEAYQVPNHLLHFIVKDVTNDDKFKMKNYWKRTRLVGKK